MSEKEKYEELRLVNELISSLTQDNVEWLQHFLDIPSAIVEKTGTNSLDFLLSLKNDFRVCSSLLHDAFNAIGRADLIGKAKQISWLNVRFHQTSKVEIIPTVESFVTLLKTEVEIKQWKLIAGNELGEKEISKLDFETALKQSVKGGLIDPDLRNLCSMMTSLSREDLIDKIEKHASVFEGMSENEFQKQILDELESNKNEKEESHQWVKCLREYVEQQFKKTSILLDDDENELLESVYTPLTVVKEELAEIKMAEETTLTEIAFLRSMGDKKKTLETIDLIELVCSHDANEPEVLCLIGNPGCGKTFLCKYIALLYGKSELTNFTYVLSVPCRSEKWHQMEKTRQKAELEIDVKFTEKWLSLGMPSDVKWSKYLIKHLIRSGGEGLLLIIDGADEFVKEVPFKSSLLYSLLQKRSLHRSTILLTSRPGAWSELREEHELKIDANFQILGFSPSDRDLYFTKRIKTADKLRDTKQLFHLHDEINQLSLVPVNASLFASLFIETANILSQTLTLLYTELIVYMIRRQLARMGLKRLTKIQHMSEFHPSILKCISRIADEAYEGIYHRELSSREDDISIEIGANKYMTERLGLMQVYVKILKLRQRVNVWSFAHLTLQEYMAAVYLENKKWVQECIIMRYIVSSEEVFNMYKMVVRFICGLLVDRAACLITIICRNLTPDPMSLVDLPMLDQLYYNKAVVGVSDWIPFSRLYLLMSTFLIETNSQFMGKFFKFFSDLFPEYLSFYFQDSVSPNEWHCFILSLKFIDKIQIQILCIDLSLISSIQLNSLLHQLSSCSLKYLALEFSKQDYQSIQTYTSLLDSTGTSIQLRSVSLSWSVMYQKLSIPNLSSHRTMS